MHFLGISLRNLISRPMRSGLTVLAIAVAVGSFIALMGAARGVNTAWTRSLAERGTHLVAVRKGAVAILSSPIDASLAERLRQVDGVRDVAGELINIFTIEADGESDDEPGHPVFFMGWPRESYLWKSLTLSAGDIPRADQPNGVVLGQATAEVLGKAVGDDLRIRRDHKRVFVVTGICKYAGTVNNNAVILPLATMEELTGRPGKVTFLNIRLARPDESQHVSAVKATLAEMFPELQFAETRDIGEHHRMLRVMRAMAWSVSMIALFMGALVILNTLLMSVSERTYDIGVLSAVGWQAGRILSMIVIEGLLLAAMGSAIGSLLGIAGLRLLADLPPVHGFLEPEVTPRLVFEAIAASALLGVLGSLYPAWRAVRLNPVDALRHE